MLYHLTARDNNIAALSKPTKFYMAQLLTVVYHQ